MCTDCEARRRLARDALFKAKVGEALGHVAKGVAEAAGWKEKTGVDDLYWTSPSAPRKRSAPKKNSRS